MSANAPSPPPPKSRFSMYTNALKAISKSTGTPLPSLILSFGIVHELTALVPLIGVFYTSRALGVGEAIVNSIVADPLPNELATSGGEGLGAVRWGKEKVREWVEEGDKWAERVGRRYGMFGYEKRKPGEGAAANNSTSEHGHRIAGDVANAVVAYGVTKVGASYNCRASASGFMSWPLGQALLPVRVGLSMYLAPAFARSALDPVRRAIIGVFRKPQP